ncbi:MAG TPA: TIGR03619 family F420-dependent LLM class oxidoreductase [Acidimicrobiales bacterium]|nr:TIGR03619 family F420-dependent LLM class oxidoreductase [Acidimicrobiales bacterium]
MQLGLVTPIVNLNPRFEALAWERDGTMTDVAAVAREAERLGYSWISCPEHIAIPEEVASVRGGRYWDPLVTLSYVAASTTTIGLLSHVVVLGYHHPLEIVKRYGTLDVASGGRVILGVGVGSLQAEFELLGVEFADRGARADDALRAIRSSFGQRSPSYAGSHYRYAGFFVEPSGIDRPVSIWVGGRTRRSLRRALELGDGWIPFGLPHDELRAMLAAAPVVSALADRQGAFDVILAPEPALDPVGDPVAAAATVRAYAELGATGLSLRFRHRSRDHYMEQLAAMAQVTADVARRD